MSATSSNHAEILAIHEASQECVWLRSVIQHVRESSGISSGQEAPTVVHEDNVVCISQLKDGYIKGDRTKHMLPNLFFTHDLKKDGDIIVQQIRSSDNLADLFTKALPTAKFKKFTRDDAKKQGDKEDLSEESGEEDEEDVVHEGSDSGDEQMIDVKTKKPTKNKNMKEPPRSKGKR
nr:retrovirus-related Pol polyprotein from transposon TNT 1-94 [Tanacetum cinerariifolium]